ncbi:MAG: SGNH/GDSL hydrolase family protein [Cyanobacteria bacterium J06643_4]
MTKPTKPKKRYVVGAIAGGLSFLALEFFLRTAVGLATPALVITDAKTGYRFKPNQSVTRLGNRITYNQYSQRSDAIQVDKPDNTLRILMVGDSVLNGGSHITQADTITEKLETKLLEQNYPAEVLNASAGSWGISNLKGYLDKFGTFQSDIVILQIGSHDLIQPTSTSDAVGRASHPDKSPLLATQALITHYIWPQVSKKFGNQSKLADEIPDALSPEQQFQQNMDSLSELAQTLAEQDVPLYILYTPARADVLSGDRTSEHKAAFTQKLTDLSLPLIDVQAAWTITPAETIGTYFRDRVHLSAAGNEAVTALLYETLIAVPAVTEKSNNFPSNKISHQNKLMRE